MHLEIRNTFHYQILENKKIMKKIIIANDEVMDNYL